MSQGQNDITETVVDTVVSAAETEDRLLREQQELAEQLAERLREHETQQNSLEGLKEQVKHLREESQALLLAVPDLQHRIVDSERKILELQKAKRAQEERIQKACQAHYCVYTRIWKPYLEPYLSCQNVGVTGLLMGAGYLFWKRRL